MTTYYYLHCADDSGWEEVDEYIFEKWQIALNVNGTSRYSGNRVKKTGGSISIFAEEMSPKNYAIIMRLLGVKESDVGSLTGYLKKPDSVILKSPRGKGTLLKVVNGEIYKKAV